jgi:hypothetical protein
VNFAANGGEGVRVNLAGYCVETGREDLLRRADKAHPAIF